MTDSAILSRPWLLWPLLFALAAIVYGALYARAHPEAALDLRVDRNQAQALSREFLESQGFDLESKRVSLGFYDAGQARNFLEKELEPAEANAVLASNLGIFYWYARWYTAETQEEFGVALNPAGRLIYFSHTIPEDAPAEPIELEAARSLAEAFIVKQGHFTLEDLTPVEDHQEQLPNRTDTYFEWEWKEFDRAGAKYRIAVQVRGNGVGYYSEYLKTPEDWDRNESRKSGLRSTISQIASIGRYVLLFATLGALYWLLRRDHLYYRVPLALVGGFSLLSLLNWANEVPSSWLMYDTTTDPTAFLGNQVLGLCLEMLSSGLGLFMTALAADGVARRVFPHVPSLGQWRHGRVWCTRQMGEAALAGLALAMLHSAYYGVFYMVCKHFGGWAPQSVSYSNLLSTPMPWLYPLTVGFRAAIDEELLFRVFAIGAIYRIARHKGLAIAVPAVVWGFLHTFYPQEPVYIRGVELTIVGIVYGLFYWRYGALCTIIAHFTYNALGAASFLWSSGQATHQLTSAAVLSLALAPLLPVAWRLARRVPLEDFGDAIASLPAPQRWVYPEGKTTFDALPPKQVGLLPGRVIYVLVLAALSGALVTWEKPKEETLAGFLEVRVSRVQAIGIATAALRNRDLDPGRYTCTASYWVNDFGMGRDYLWEQIGSERGMNRWLRARRDALHGWSVRFFRAGETEQFRVWVNPSDGRLMEVTHVVAEDAEGARLEEEAARALAARRLKEALGFDVAAWTQVVAQGTSRPARMDYHFTWEDPASRVGEAHFRASTRVQGDAVQETTFHLDVPEAWEREQNAFGVFDLMRNAALAVSALGALCSIMLVSVFPALQPRTQVRAALGWGAITGVAVALLSLNRLPSFWRGYDTSESAFSYIVTTLISDFCVTPAGVFIGAAVLVYVSDEIWRRAYADRLRPVELLGAAPVGVTRFSWRDRLLLWGEASVVASALMLGEDIVSGMLLTGPAHGTPEFDSVGGVRSFFPYFDEGLRMTLLSGLIFLMFSGVAAQIRLYCKKYWVGALLGAWAVFMITLQQAETTAELAGAAGGAVLAAICYLLPAALLWERLLTYNAASLAWIGVLFLGLKWLQDPRHTLETGFTWEYLLSVSVVTLLMVAPPVAYVAYRLWRSTGTEDDERSDSSAAD
ncbi:MAG: CPBP family intramembrane metalloprotease [Candidatus Hydrogenedentes bacterium]|nr:CPBP family intramembrane metalloprotease [Candidatus Hydrogenedentota bacterium]